MPRPTDTPGVSWHGRGRVLLEIGFIRGSSDGIGEVGDPPCGVDVCGRWLVLVLVDGVGNGVGIGAIVRILRGGVDGRERGGGRGGRSLNVIRHHPW